jgi:hypothetical protein
VAQQPRNRFIGEGKHPKGKGVFHWSIDGPAEVIGQPACPLHPEFFYEVLVEDQTDAEILHIIWNKKPPSGSTAIERVCIDNEGDFAQGKTPHFSDFTGRVCIMSFCSFGEYDLQVSVVWRDTSNNDKHLETKSFKITSKPK